MIINCISLPQRYQRKAQSIKEFDSQNAAYVFWPGFTGNIPRTNVSRAHKSIVQFAKNNSIKRILISEDDVKFTAPGAFDYYLKNMPETFDLYLGCISSGTINKEEKTVSKFTGLIFYTICETFYDKFLSVREDKHIDIEVSKLDGISKVCYPFCCTTYSGYSDLRKRIVNDSKYFKGRKLFTGSPSLEPPPIPDVGNS